MADKPANQYSITLELPADGPEGGPVRAFAVNVGDDSMCEASLTQEQARQLLWRTYADSDIVKSLVERLHEDHVVELAADSKSKAIFLSQELVELGFPPERLKF